MLRIFERYSNETTCKTVAEREVAKRGKGKEKGSGKTFEKRGS